MERKNTMEVICLENEAFYSLIEKVIKHFDRKISEVDDKWISDVEAMRLLRIKSKTTLQKFRDTGKIRFSQPEKKIILYDRYSILDHLEQNSRDTF